MKAASGRAWGSAHPATPAAATPRISKAALHTRRPCQDAPNHFLNGGATIEQLPLSALIGPADIIDVPDSTNVTADALRALDVPTDATRLLFRTLNTRRRLMEVTPFASDYVGLDASAARWLAEERPGVVLVGIDYVSIGMLEDIVEAHKELFRKVGACVRGV
jgi:arylformamidase